MKKLIFLLVLPLILSFQDNTITRMFYNEHIEILNGKVKQLIVTGVGLRGTPFLWSYADTTTFNIKGEEIETRSGWSDGLHIIDKADFKNTEDRKEIEFLAPSGNGKTIQKYDKSSRLLGTYYYNLDGIYQTIIYHYDALGNISQTDTYDRLNALSNRTVLKYNNQRLLTEEDYFALNAKTYTENTLYEYKSFDNRGNWKKRVRKMKSSRDTMAFLTDTVTRKITYY